LCHLLCYVESMLLLSGTQTKTDRQTDTLYYPALMEENEVELKESLHEVVSAYLLWLRNTTFKVD
jgi:hypothetical protein